MAEPGGERSRWYEGSRWYEKPAYDLTWYGALGPLVDLSEDAPIPPGGQRRWYVSDHDAFRSSLSFEDQVKSKGLPADAPPDVRAELNGYLDSFYAALPFTEGERVAVRKVYREEDERGRASREIPSQIRKQQFEVVSAGLETVIRGGDLMRRWWAWRRELDEFEGQGGIQQARTALTDFAGRLVPPEHMPNVYFWVQGQERPVPYQDWC